METYVTEFMDKRQAAEFFSRLAMFYSEIKNIKLNEKDQKVSITYRARHSIRSSDEYIGYKLG